MVRVPPPTMAASDAEWWGSRNGRRLVRLRPVSVRQPNEGAEILINGDGRIVCYMGDDQRFDYVYKYVSHDRYNPDNQDADGSLTWMPLVYDSGPLTQQDGFSSQADVLIETRRAADLLGATPMDRPEDVQPNPTTGRVYVMLTNNTRRKGGDINAANPRGPNPHGHILEMTPPAGDHSAVHYSWKILLQCGDPSDPATKSTWGAGTSDDGWFEAPANAAVDGMGRLWAATDGKTFGSRNNGLWAIETDGTLRGTSKHFFRMPVGVELCGPRFTPDDRSLFVSVQHPGDTEVKKSALFNPAATFEEPATRWPNFKPGLPPRPSVVVITRKDWGVIAT